MHVLHVQLKRLVFLIALLAVLIERIPVNLVLLQIEQFGFAINERLLHIELILVHTGLDLNSFIQTLIHA